MNPLSKEEFEEKYHLYAQELMNISYGYTRNKEDSLDIIQNVFYKFFTCNKEFSCLADEKYWLIHVTINECKDLLRKKARFETLDEKTIDTFSLKNYTIEKSKELYTLAEKVERLSEKYRVVIILYYYDSLPIKEISKVLKISETAVKKRLERARIILKKEMEE